MKKLNLKSILIFAVTIIITGSGCQEDFVQEPAAWNLNPSNILTLYTGSNTANTFSAPGTLIEFDTRKIKTVTLSYTSTKSTVPDVQKADFVYGQNSTYFSDNLSILFNNRTESSNKNIISNTGYNVRLNLKPNLTRYNLVKGDKVDVTVSFDAGDQGVYSTTQSFTIL